MSIDWEIFPRFLALIVGGTTLPTDRLLVVGLKIARLLSNLGGTSDDRPSAVARREPSRLDQKVVMAVDRCYWARSHILLESGEWQRMNRISGRADGQVRNLKPLQLSCGDAERIWGTDRQALLAKLVVD